MRTDIVLETIVAEIQSPKPAEIDSAYGRRVWYGVHLSVRTDVRRRNEVQAQAWARSSGLVTEGLGGRAWFSSGSMAP